MDQTARLAELLESLLERASLRMWLRTLPEGPDIVRHLPGPIASDATLFAGAARLLVKQGVKPGLFESLAETCPGGAAEIRDVQAWWLSNAPDTLAGADVVTASSSDERLLLRYFICRNEIIAHEITEGQLARFPQLQRPMRLSNQVHRYHEDLLRLERRSTHPKDQRDRHYPNQATYLAQNPDARPSDRAGGRFSFYETIRPPRSGELEQCLPESGSISRELLTLQRPWSEIGLFAGYLDECGEPVFVEHLIQRRLWFVYLAITNFTARPLRLVEVQAGEELPAKLGYRPLEAATNRLLATHPLPRAPLAPAESVVLPVASALAPLGASGLHCVSVESLVHDPISENHWLHMRRIPRHEGVFHLLGPALYPKGVLIEQQGERIYQPVHDFDLTSIYEIDRVWAVGSCPHLFFISGAGACRYVGDLFSNSAGHFATEHIDVPEGVERVIIAELEPEQTHIEGVWTSAGEHVAGPCVLDTGETLELAGVGGQRLSIRGTYRPRTGTALGHADAVRRNEWVCGFLASRRDRLSAAEDPTYPPDASTN